MPSLRDRRVLVTGAAGFIGRRTVESLLKLGARVYASARAGKPTPAGAVRVSGDLREPSLPKRLIRVSKPEYILHLAATRRRETEPSAYTESLEDNLLPTARLMAEACSLPSLRRFIICGSSEEYGPGKGARIETWRESPTNAYAVSKVCATALAQGLFRARGLPTVVLRPTLVYGPGQPADGMLIPTLIHRLKAGRRFEMTKGLQTRDFVYIDDVVNGIVLAMTAPAAPGTALNLGSGKAIRIVDAAKKAAKLLGRADLLKVGAIPGRAGERMDGRVSAAAAKKILGWTAKVSLDAGLRLTAGL